MTDQTGDTKIYPFASIWDNFEGLSHKKWHTCTQEDLFMNVYSGLIQDSPKLEPQIVGYSKDYYSVVKKEQTSNTPNFVDDFKNIRLS